MMKRKLFAMILDVAVVGAGGGIIENFHAAKRQLSTNVRVYGLPYLVCCTVDYNSIEASAWLSTWRKIKTSLKMDTQRILSRDFSFIFSNSDKFLIQKCHPIFKKLIQKNVLTVEK